MYYLKVLSLLTWRCAVFSKSWDSRIVELGLFSRQYTRRNREMRVFFIVFLQNQTALVKRQFQKHLESRWQNIDQQLKVHTWDLPVIYLKTKIQEMGLIWGHSPSFFRTPFTKLQRQNVLSKPSEVWHLASLLFAC